MIVNITIVTYNWPPRNAIGTHRPYAWAKYWSEAGHNIQIITAKKQVFDGPLDLTLPPLPGVRVHEVDYTRSPDFIARLFSSPQARNLLRRMYRFLRGNKLSSSHPRDAWAASTVSQLPTILGDCDVVVSTFGPKGSAIIAAAIKRERPHVFWLSDFRDLWSENSNDDWAFARRDKELEQELAVIKEADLLSTVSAELADKLEALHKKPVIVSYNGYDSSLDAAEAAWHQRTSFEKPVLNIVYTGKIYPNTRDPRPLLQAILKAEDLGLFPRGAVKVHFYGDQLEAIGRSNANQQCRHFVVNHGHVPRNEALDAQQNADILLLLESPLPQAQGVLTGKVFEYLASGRPILSLGSTPDSAIGRLLRETGTGVCLGDDERQIIERLVAMRKQNSFLGFEPNRDRIQRYSRRHQASLLLAHLLDAKG